MTVKEFAQCVEYNIEHNLKHAVLGLGAPGVGKSQVIRQIGDKYGYKVIDIRLAQMSEVEIGGLIYPNEDHTKTKWLSPEILPDEERDGKNTILLLDEITSCPKRVQVAAYQLILDRRVGQYTLPEGTFVVALGNREDDDGVYIRLSGPLADRFEIHYLEPNFEDWKNDYALKNGVHSYVVDYLTFKPAALHTQSVSGDNMVFATPRSWVRVSDILNIDDDMENPVIRYKIIGNIGEAEGLQFIDFCRKQNKKVSPDEFLKGNVKAPKDAAERSILIRGLTAKASFVKNVKSYEELSPEQQTLLQSIVKALFRLESSEEKIIGLRQLMEWNRQVMKEALLSLDDPELDTFIGENMVMLRLSEEAKGGQTGRRWLEIFRQ